MRVCVCVGQSQWGLTAIGRRKTTQNETQQNDTTKHNKTYIVGDVLVEGCEGVFFGGNVGKCDELIGLNNVYLRRVERGSEEVREVKEVKEVRTVTTR